MQQNGRQLVLATILGTKGSAPQVPGASALFSSGELLSGTLGGGILEHDASERAAGLLKEGFSMIYEFGLNADITEEDGAICGGTAIIMLDANPGKNTEAFRSLAESIGKERPGILATIVSGKDRAEIERFWLEKGAQEGSVHRKLNEFSGEMTACLEKGNCLYIEKPGDRTVFLEPVRPLPKLVIAGAGHIGRSLAHMANLLDFEVTVIDDRPEYANPQNIPDADHIVAGSIGKAIRQIPKTGDTYIVIVTRGHRDDADALRACIDSDIAYIGMIGSKKKVRLMRENFLSREWATAERFDRVHTPVGLEINSKTVQEIAVSICAELIQVRNRGKLPRNGPDITAVILAAGESRRMGRPKMSLPFGDCSIIERVVKNAVSSGISRTLVVLGSDNEEIGNLIQDYPVEPVHNRQYRNGMLSSVQCGLQAVPDKTDAVMVLLGDQPMIGSNVMDRMIEAYRKSGREIIVAMHQGKRGHPILFGSRYFREVMGYSEKSSLKDLIHTHPDDIQEVETNSPAILRDIDTEKDYRKELKHQHNHD